MWLSVRISYRLMEPTKTDRLRERLWASEAAREGQRKADTAMHDELTGKNKALEKDCLRLRKRTSKLQKEVRNLRKKARRAPGQRSREVEAAVAKAADEFKEHSNVWRIKRPDGRIENWVRDLACRLMTVHHLPATHTPGAISDVLQAIKANTSDCDGANDGSVDPCADPGRKETFSDRSARRFPLEGRIMGEMMLAEELKATPG